VDLNRRIDGYCERVGPEFWAEPLNTATNAAFILAALVGLIVAVRSGRLDGPVAYLVGLTFVIGIGSFLFHTFATVWAAIADTTPISLFILSYFAVAMNRFAGFGWGRAVLLTIAFQAGMVLMSWGLRETIAPLIGSSTSYLPAFVALLAVGLWLNARAHPAGRWMVAAAAVFAVSLTFRTLDGPLCDTWPAGTHFLWHILNGFVLGTLALAVVRHGTPPRLAGRARIA
jgi:hypothetical protein